MFTPDDHRKVLDRIKEPTHWATAEVLLDALRNRPSLRGFTYGYVAEQKFLEHVIQPNEEVKLLPRDDDHKKTKSDCTILYREKQVTIQVKSMQTNSIKLRDGIFHAVVQNDASDKRPIKLPHGKTVSTTCYKVGEYDLLAVALQPFRGDWSFAFKLNQDLRLTRSTKYPPKVQRQLLATTEPISYPLDNNWTDDFARALREVLRRRR